MTIIQGGSVEAGLFMDCVMAIAAEDQEDIIRAIVAIAAAGITNHIYNHHTILMNAVANSVISLETKLFAIKSLCIAGADISLITAVAHSAMHSACQAKETEVIRTMLRFGFVSTPEVVNDAMSMLGKKYAQYILKTSKSLHEAAETGDFDTMSSLISEGAVVTGLNVKGDTPLHIVAAIPEDDEFVKERKLMCTKLLLQEGANPNALSGGVHRMTPLSRAIMTAVGDHATVANMMRLAGARSQVLPVLGGSKFLITYRERAMRRQRYIPISRLLLDNLLKSTELSVFRAVVNYDLRVLRLLLEAGESPNLMDPTSNVSLLHALLVVPAANIPGYHVTQAAIMALLLEYGFDINSRSQDGLDWNIMHAACFMHCSVEVFRSIIRAGVDHRSNPVQYQHIGYREVLELMFISGILTAHQNLGVPQVNSIQDLGAVFLSEGIAF